MFAKKRLLVLGTVMVLLAAGGYAYADTHASTSSYRTAVATKGTVQRTLTVTGTTASSGDRDLSFGTSGTIENVLIKQGQHVKKHQLLARLDSTNLRAAVLSAQAALAKAQAQLVTDQTTSSTPGPSPATSAPLSNTAAAESTGGTGTAASPGSAAKSHAPPAGTTGTAHAPSAGASGPQVSTSPKPTLNTTPNGRIGQAESTLTTAGTTLSDAVRVLSNDAGSLTETLDNYVSFVQNACTSSDTTQTGGPCDPAATASPTGCQTSAPNSLAEAKAYAGGCRAAVDADQENVDRDQQNLTDAATGLTHTAQAQVRAYLTEVTSYAAGPNKPPASVGKNDAQQILAQAKQQAQHILAQAKQQAQQALAQAEQQAKTAATTGASSSAVGGFTRSSPSTSTSRAKLVANDQSTIASAEASLVAARQAARAAALRSPIAGTVVNVALTEGNSVAPSDTVMTVLGSGPTTVSADIGLARIAEVRAGQAVSVVPAGSQKVVRGVVTAVGLIPATSSSGTTTYPVTITLVHAPAVPLGTTASVGIVTGKSTKAVTVPTSAVTPGSRTATVTILRDGNATTQPVTVGLVGTTKTAINKGLNPGTTVVLADLQAALPSSSSTSTSRGGLAGFGGGLGRIGRPGGRGTPVR